MLAELVAPLLAALPPGRNLVGVGAAAAGLVRRADGFLSVSPNRGWRDAPLGEMIASSLGVESRAGGQRSRRRRARPSTGAASPASARHVIYVSGEVGLGLGVIYDGRPMFGAAGFAGEAGHTVINPDGRPCRCGVDRLLGDRGRRGGLRPAGRDRMGRGVRQELIDEVLRRAHRGDPQVFEAFRDVGRWLGLGVGNLVNMFNPELIVFGGFYHSLYPFLEEPMIEAAQGVALAAPWAACRIRRSGLGLDARLIGAAELVFADVVANPSRATALRSG